jgi:DeoR family transcriptional regulator, aga operon transcriptional repressor
VRRALADTMPHAVSRKRIERMRLLLSLLRDQPDPTPLALDELAVQLRVSKATIRRDLAALEDENLLVRTHGGARAAELPQEIPVRLRTTQSQRAKQLIARRTAQLIPAGPHALAVSGGTTTTEVVRALRYHADLTVITNALSIAAESAAWPRIKVIVTGGRVRAHSLEAVGPLSEATFNSVNVATAVLGADGVSAEGGVTTHDETEARTNRAMVMHAQRVIVAADGSKIARIMLARMADLSEVHDLVTDSSADPAELERIRKAGVHLHVVD